MSFFYERRIYPSDKNGDITCVRALGKWHITAGGIGQTTPYVTKMWRRALDQIPRHTKIKNVLILGLGGGGQVESLRRKFTDCHITAVEWDPVMVKIAEDFKIFKPEHKPFIIIQDATQALKEMSTTFDLVLVDLFTGTQPIPALYSIPFLNLIADRLKPDGFLLLNVFKKPALFEVFDQVFSRAADWHFQYNKLALYRHQGKGIMGDPLPDQYYSLRQSLSYLKGEREKNSHKRVVGEKGCWGMRWRHGPLWFEGYESDKEPATKPFSSARFIIWQPISRKDKPAGWRRSWIQMNFRHTGFAQITNPDSYWKSWSAHAQRHRKKWLQNQNYIMEEETSLPEFSRVYSQISRLLFLKKAFIRLIEQQKKANGNLLHLFVVKDSAKKKIVAGLAVLDLPDTNSSAHLISFIHPKVKNTSIGVGLIDHWFQHAIKNNITFLNFGVFWGPGDPKGWKGFSKFKSQFGIFLIKKPNPLIKFIRKNK